MNKIKIIRVQDQNGRGPYKPGFSKFWKDKGKPELPSMMHEFGTDWILNLSPYYQHGCGFTSMDQLRRWFSPSELTRLKELGYNIVEMEVDKILQSSYNQVVFARLEKLKTNYRVIV